MNIPYASGTLATFQSTKHVWISVTDQVTWFMKAAGEPIPNSIFLLQRTKKKATRFHWKLERMGDCPKFSKQLI